MNCPKCGYRFDCHTYSYDETKKPREKDISICLSCGAVHQFKGNMLVNVDIEKLPADVQQEIIMFQEARRKVLNIEDNYYEEDKD